MQIHELTRKRRVDEASFGGAIKNIGSAIGAVGAGIGKELASQAGFDTAGTVGANSATKNEAFARAKALTVPMIKPQAIENQKLWNQLAAQKMAAAGVSSLSALPPDQMDELNDALHQQIAKNFLKGQTGNDYGQLPEKVDPQMKAEADKVVGLLDDAIDSIMNVGFNKTPAQSLNDWTKLVTAGFDAMRLLQFYPAAGVQRAAAPITALSPKAQALANAIGLDRDGIEKLNYAITRAGEKINDAGTGSQSLDELLKAARLLR